jgi:hypothetical protein
MGGGRLWKRVRILAQPALRKHWSKNDQIFAGHAGKGLQQLSRSLSTGGSTVIVNN